MSCRKVVIESPYAGDVEANLDYARRCMRDSLQRGEHPIASHLLYTQAGILDDSDPAERAIGIEAGLAWGALADLTAVYIDRGTTESMRLGIARARDDGRPVEHRRLECVDCQIEQDQLDRQLGKGGGEQPSEDGR